MVAAAAVREGQALSTVKSIAARANNNLSTLSATLALGVNPATGLSMGEIPQDEVHYGMGVTGEPGIRIGKDLSARAVATELTEAIVEDLRLTPGDEVAVLIGGGGCVTVLEELLLCGHVCALLEDSRIHVFDVDVSERIRVERTNAVSVSVMKLDEELKRYFRAEAASPLVFKRHF
jgi:dihydroxyacetone kinase-like protein